MILPFFFCSFSFYIRSRIQALLYRYAVCGIRELNFGILSLLQVHFRERSMLMIISVAISTIVESCATDDEAFEVAT